MSAQFDIRVNTHNGAAEVNTVSQALGGAARATDTWQSRLSSLGAGAFNFNNISSAISNVAGKFQSAWSLVDKAMNFGATKTSFEVLIGNAEQGRKLAEELNAVQQKTILGPEVFEASQTMLGFGIATKDVVKDIKMMGDVAMGNRDKFKSLSLVFSQTQATGRLMGQDLLQYINAGFNPLTVMSEKWEQFGFKSKKSVGELKEMVEKGGISSGMVAKAFEVATASGGKFAGMMDTIGETSYGKMQQLEGSWENLKVSAGEALLPIANDLMSVASKTIDWLGITKTAPEVLSGEQAGINGLMGEISVLNEGNSLRHDLLAKLVHDYPSLFGNIDIEKVKNGELIDKLKEVNGLYEKRIELATNQMMADKFGDGAKEDFAEYTRNKGIADAMRRGDTMGANALKKWNEGWFREQGEGASYYDWQAEQHKIKFETENQGAAQAKKRLAAGKDAQTVEDALAISKDPDKLAGLFGAAGRQTDAGKKLQQTFLEELAKETKLEVGAGGLAGLKLTGGPDAKKLDDIMNSVVNKVDKVDTGLYDPNATDKKKKKAPHDKTARETASNIASGGNRATHIELKIGTLVGEYNLHTTNLQAGGKESAKQVVALLLEEIQGLNQALEDS